ncbi:MAG: citramalate synthase [Spirochaetales bacterium]|nr:citramalate synthase [Spirochaetales bacterium]
MNKSIKIFDTTLRDGSQSVGINFTVNDKIKIARKLDEFGVHYVEGGWPGSNPKDVAFFEEMKSIKLENAKMTAFSSTRMKNIKVEDDKNIARMIETGVPVVTIFGKSWDLHVRDALKTTEEENLDMIYSTMEYLKKYFDEVIYDAEHFFDGYRANPEYTLKTLAAAEKGGADWLVLCDTNGGSMVDFVTSTVDTVRSQFTKPIGIHAHNDSELAVANSLAAVKHGAAMVQGTINGIGERCGNANLCSVIPNLSIKGDYTTVPPENLKQLYYISHLVTEISNQTHPDGLPFVGKKAFSHKGGIHVSAVRKNSATYEHITPESVGNERVITISELSGRSNIIEKAEQMGIDLRSDSEKAGKILKRVKELEAKGYHYEGAEASFELLTNALMGTQKRYFELHGYRIIIWKNADGESWAEATIKAAVPEEVAAEHGYESHIEHTSADGSGPVEALDKALRKVLEKFYPELKKAHLVDYKVRILNAEEGTNSTTRVMIITADDENRWSTVGVSDNIIDASWQALVESLIYKLVKDEEKK